MFIIMGSSSSDEEEDEEDEDEDDESMLAIAAVGAPSTVATARARPARKGRRLAIAVGGSEGAATLRIGAAAAAAPPRVRTCMFRGELGKRDVRAWASDLFSRWCERVWEGGALFSSRAPDRSIQRRTRGTFQ
jgi:hypothetical protein